jgi:transposase
MQNKLAQKLKERDEEIAELKSDIARMQFQIDQMRRLLYGSKRERFISDKEDENQLTLPLDIEQETEPEKEQEVVTYVREKSKRKNHPGRLELPKHLPVEEIIIEPKEDTTGLRCIGKEVTDQLEMVPAKLYIKRYIRPRYIKPVDAQELQHQGVIAPLPVFPIEKGIAGPGLLAQVLVDKFVDHLPIYRQLGRFKREEIKIASSTINGWQESCANLLEPLYDCLKNRVLKQGYIQADETPIQVLDKSKKGQTHRGYFWEYRSPLTNTILFDYRRGRGRDGPQQLLAGFTGYLQTDGYAAYNKIGERKDIIVLNCMAHARRYFEKSLDSDKSKAEYAMGMFQKVYAVERKARDANLSPEKRKELRLDEALPILNELGKWIAASLKEVLPKSPIGAAVQYCIPRWDNLTAYLYDGNLEIDNNLAENAIRPITLGRKNYLFAGSDRGAERAAMFYSFFGTCKANGINPYQWLKRVLEIIPEHKVNRLFELLPQNLEL